MSQPLLWGAPRLVASPAIESVTAVPKVGGLDHYYLRLAA